ncbi:MAG: HAD-IB family phosphatase [Chitinophagaceae bacterium]
MISIIIPALNEESTIKFVIEGLRNSKNVDEIIVVDDKSLDKTVELSIEAGAKVITGTKLGKGSSMKDGLLIARNEIILYLDADITTYPKNIVELMTNPIIEEGFDFVKAYFTRQAGRVTELVAKPLLSILYPDFPSFIQPLSGMIAGKKLFFNKIEFEEGYGVDIGILIDMYKLGAKIKEVNIGNIENRMQSLEQLGYMSKAVASTIIEKSSNTGKKNLEVLENIQVIREQMEFAIREKSKQLSKIAILDMDNTLLSSSFIHTCSKKFNFQKELLDIISSQQNPFIRTKQIAKLLKGKSVNDLIKVAEEILISKNAENLINHLKENGYKIGIISDSYDYITNFFVNKLRLDFSLANELEFSKSIATGEVKIPSFFLPHSQSICNHEICKSHALTSICQQLNIDIANTIAIGDGENDICMVKKSGIGIAYCSSNQTLNLVADFIIKEKDLGLISGVIS